MRTVSKYLGSQVFNNRVIKTKLPAWLYKSVKRAIHKGAKLIIGVNCSMVA